MTPPKYNDRPIICSAATAEQFRAHLTANKKAFREETSAADEVIFFLAARDADLLDDLNCLGFSSEATKTIEDCGISTVNKLCRFTPEDIKAMEYVGIPSLEEIQEALSRIGRRLSPHPDYPV